MAAVSLQAQVPADPALARAMDSLFKKDQWYRQLIYAIDSNTVIKDSVARAAGIPAHRDSVLTYLVAGMGTLDASNFRFIDSVVEKAGLSR